VFTDTQTASTLTTAAGLDTTI